MSAPDRRPIEQRLRDVAAALDEVGVRWALVGGLAVSARTEPRFTRDIDLAVAIDSQATLDAMVYRLRAYGYRPLTLLARRQRDEMATIRLVPRDHPRVIVDLLAGTAGIEDEVVAAATPETIVPGLRIRVARTGHLIALKLLSHSPRKRPRDGLDLDALFRVANGAELARARRAATLIMARGYARGKDLLAGYERWRRRSLG